MNFFTKLAIKRQSATIIAMILVIIIGIFSFRSLEAELFPDIELNFLAISASYPDASPESIVSEITKPIESAITVLPDVEGVSSTSSEGQVFVLIEYSVGIDMKSAEISIKNKLNNLTLPPNANFEILKFGPSEQPILSLSFSSLENISELQKFVEEAIVPSLEIIKGVKSIDLTGNTEKQITIQIDVAKATEIGISLSQIAKLIKDSNFSIPSGSIIDSGTMINIRGVHQIDSLVKLKQLPIKAQPSSTNLIRLSDIAKINVIRASTSSTARTNGISSILLSVSKESNASTIEITENSLKIIEAAKLPTGTEIKIIYNAGPEIQSQLNTLTQEATWGFVFAVFVVFIFLLKPRPNLLIGIRESIRPTIIIGASIPLSILVGIILLKIQGLTLNFMTLAGLAIAVGRVVDDSIVVLESIYRHIQNRENRLQATLDGTIEVSNAITASTLATIAVFVPLGFIPGLVGSFFFPFSLAVSYALIGSLFVALTIIPVLGLILLQANKDTGDKSLNLNDTPSLIQRYYRHILTWTLGHKLATVFLSILLTISSMGLLKTIPIVFFPASVDKQITASYKTRSGAPPEEILEYISTFEKHLDTLRQPGYIKDYLTVIGNGAFSPGGGPPQFGGARIITNITLSNTAPINMINNLRETFPEKNNYSIKFEEINLNGPPNEGLEIQVTGSNYAKVKELSQHLVKNINLLDGVVNIETNITGSLLEITTEINPDAALSLGLSAKEVSRQISDATTTKQLGILMIDEKATKVTLQPLISTNQGIAILENMPIISSFNSEIHSKPLKDLAEITIKSSPLLISRIDNQRAVTITGEITGRNIQAINRDIQKLIDSMVIPQGISIQLGGAFTQINEGFRDIGIAIGAGIALVSIVMIGFLGSIRNPIIIILSMPLASSGMLAALAVTNKTLGLPAMMGVLLLIGIIVTNTVVLISYIEQLRERGDSVLNSIIEASTIRLRPILMTAFTTGFALLPLAAFSHIEKGLISTELAIAVIGGLVSSTALTLILVPVLYEMFHDVIPKKINSIFKINKQALSNNNKND